MTPDLALLKDYAENKIQASFTALVERHLDLVYSAALRQVRSPQLAEEVAQLVFTDLARSADKLKPDTVLTAWLYQVTRRTAIDVIRRESRRQLRERVAAEVNAMNATVEDWTNIEPLLDDAMNALDETDRTAVLLRYFENQSLREVGNQLGISDDAAQKRVSWAVDRLREFFTNRGVTIGASGLVAVVSANAVQAAPAVLAITITSATATAGTTAATVAATTTKVIAMTTLQKTLIGTTLAIVTGAGIYGVYKASEGHSQKILSTGAVQAAGENPASAPLRLYTRTIHIEEKVVVQNLHRMVPPNEGESDSQLLLRFLKENKVEMNPPETIYLEEKKGEIWVRTTLDKLDKIEVLVRDKLSRVNNDSQKQAG